MRWFRNLPLLTRTLVLVIGGLTVILAVLGVVSARALRESTDRELAHHLRLAQLVTLHIDEHVQEAFSLLEHAATHKGFDLGDGDLEPERHALQEVYRTGAFTYDVFVADKNGVVLLVEPDLPQVVGADLSAHPHVRAALQTGQRQVSNLITGAAVPRSFVSFVLPLKDKTGAVVGLVGGTVDPASPAFAGFILGPAVENQGTYIQIVDANGLVIAHSQGKNVGEPVEHPEAVLPLLAGKKAGVVTREVEEVGKGRFVEVIAFVPSQFAPWGVFVEQPEIETLASMYGLRQALIIAGAIVLFTAIVLTWLTVQAVVAPVRQLLAATRRLAAGDLDKPVVIAGRDEIAELGSGFEAMRQRLQQREQTIAAWGEELEQAVQKRTERLSLLNRISRALSSTLDLDELLEVIYQEVSAVIAADAFFIALYDQASDMLDYRIRVDRGVREPAQREPLTIGLAVSVITNKQPLLIRDFEREKEHLPPATVWGTMQVPPSWLGVPMLAPLSPRVDGGTEEQVIGVIAVQAYRPNAYGEAEQELLSTIADAVAVAIENARLYQRLEESKAALEAKVRDLERFTKHAVGRELRMKELKERIEELEEQKRGA